MTANEILSQLQEFGDEQTKSTHRRHGAKEPFYGVKIQHLKKILKKTKKNHELSLELYATGNSDAMYLAGLMADEKQITKEQLDVWVEKAYWPYLSECTVPWVAAETDFGFEIGLKWIESGKENVAAAGWATLASFASVNEDKSLNIMAYEQLLEKVKVEIHSSQNRVRYAMNGFVIAVGTYIEPLTEKSKDVANAIGKVNVNVGKTACKVALATAYIKKAIAKNRIGKKRKAVRC